MRREMPVCQAMLADMGVEVVSHAGVLLRPSDDGIRAEYEYFEGIIKHT